MSDSASRGRGRSRLKGIGRYLLVAGLGFVVGVLALYVRRCAADRRSSSGTPRRSSEEFTGRARRTVRTFDDYLRLEERLFAELDEEIYAAHRDGPGFELARYSAGSAADPRGTCRTGTTASSCPARTGLGVLLLHGMSDSPYSLRALGERLNEQGLLGDRLRLPGHGTAPSGLRSVRWEDMAAAVRLAMEHLGRQGRPGPIHVVGYSTGAPLALDYALDALDGELRTAGAGEPGADLAVDRRSRRPRRWPSGRRCRRCPGSRSSPGPRSSRSSIPTSTTPSRQRRRPGPPAHASVAAGREPRARPARRGLPPTLAFSRRSTRPSRSTR